MTVVGTAEIRGSSNLGAVLGDLRALRGELEAIRGMGGPAGPPVGDVRGGLEDLRAQGDLLRGLLADLPTEHHLTFQTNAPATASSVRGYGEAVRRVPASHRTAFHADTRAAQNDVRALERAIDRLPTRRTITLQVKTEGGVPGFQGGVHDFAGGLALVGEAGPELVALPRGADVIPAGRTKSLFSRIKIPSKHHHFSADESEPPKAGVTQHHHYHVHGPVHLHPQGPTGIAESLRELGIATAGL
jgi:hypothetical protein